MNVVYKVVISHVIVGEIIHPNFTLTLHVLPSMRMNSIIGLCLGTKIFSKYHSFLPT